MYTGKPYVGHISGYPENMRDNPYITTGYRIGFRGFKGGFKTLFMWHNETVNVWTHFLGKLAAFVFIILVFILFPSYGNSGLELNK